MVDVPSNYTTEARLDGIPGNAFEGTVATFASELEFVGDEDWIQYHNPGIRDAIFLVHAFDPVGNPVAPVLTLYDSNGTLIGRSASGTGVGTNILMDFDAGPVGEVLFISVANITNTPMYYSVTVVRWADTTVRTNLTINADVHTGTPLARILAGAGDDVINAGTASEVHGEQGNDTINGGLRFSTVMQSAPRYFGGLGNDTINGSAETELIFGDAGNDRLSGGNAVDTVYGGIGDDLIDGGAGVDNLHGGTGSDIVSGGSESDTLYGGDGDDTLNGGGSADVMSGEHGNDRYVVDDAGDKVSEAFGSGVDLVQSSIGWSLADAAHVFGAVEHLALIGTAAVNGTPATDPPT
jgi:Ca2+-binding RTX toxin-like protein